jgi:hypothetical protein
MKTVLSSTHFDSYRSNAHPVFRYFWRWTVPMCNMFHVCDLAGLEEEKESI